MAGRARRGGGRGHRPGGVPVRAGSARPLRPPAAARPVAAPHRRQPRDRLGARASAARRDGSRRGAGARCGACDPGARRRHRRRPRRARARAPGGRCPTSPARLYARRDRGHARPAPRHGELPPAPRTGRAEPRAGGAAMTRVDELERALGDATPPDEGPARERARRTILAAHAAAAARPRRRRAARAAGLALTLLGIAGLTQPAVAEWLGEAPPARAVSRIVRDVVRPRPTPGPRTVDGPALPAAGRLLVGGPHGLWVVERDGRRHRLGAYSDATWSPNGLFVAVASGRTLAAVTPDDGRVRWRLRLAAPVRDPRWAPDLTHLAYRAGPTLRIVYGNGVHDVPAGAQAAAVAPAWRPTEPHTVAWASRAGT